MEKHSAHAPAQRNEPAMSDRDHTGRDRGGWGRSDLEAHDAATGADLEAPGEGRPPRAEDAEAGAGPDALVCYIHSISRTPVLSSEEQYALAERLETERERFLDAVLGIPEVAAALLGRWRERKAGGYVTATLSARHLEEGQRDLSSQVDRALRSAERVLARRDRALRTQAALDRKSVV